MDHFVLTNNIYGVHTMKNYKIIGIDLAKRKFHYAALDGENRVVFKAAISRDDFFSQTSELFMPQSTFAFEACGGAHYTAQRLQALGHSVILLKPKDVKPYAKTRQKNDINDSIAICKAAIDPDLMHVRPKTKAEQEIAYLHKARQNAIQQRIQRSNSLMTSLMEFGYLVDCGKAKFAKECDAHLERAFEEGYVSPAVRTQMALDCEEIRLLLNREKTLDQEIARKNKESPMAQILATIPGIGPINASILSIKPVGLYASAKDFSASLGLVPRQNTTGGHVNLGGISKQGDRYARTMLIQAGRTLVMRNSKPNPPAGKIFDLINRLKARGKGFNLICVAVANKLARIAHGCLTRGVSYQ